MNLYILVNIIEHSNHKIIKSDAFLLVSPKILIRIFSIAPSKRPDLLVAASFFQFTNHSTTLAVMPFKIVKRVCKFKHNSTLFQLTFDDQ
jgi:hypothetical protein